jgi:hypothetical protein
MFLRTLQLLFVNLEQRTDTGVENVLSTNVEVGVLFLTVRRVNLVDSSLQLRVNISLLLAEYLITLAGMTRRRQVTDCISTRAMKDIGFERAKSLSSYVRVSRGKL